MKILIPVLPATSTNQFLLRRRELPLILFVSFMSMLYFLMPSKSGDVTCLLRLHAGHGCPGCGMSRAVGRFFRADFLAAYNFHPWVFALFIQAFGFIVWRMLWGNKAMESKHVLWLVWSITANCVCLFIVWLIRTKTGHLDYVYS